MTPVGAELNHITAGVLRSILSLSVLRFLPFAVAFAGADGPTILSRIFVTCAYALVVYVAERYANFTPFALLLTYSYFTIAAVLTYQFARCVVSRLSVGLMVGCIFFVFPACLRTSARPVMLLLGWEFMLSAYSYFVDTGSEDEERSTRSLFSYLFFLFVNPCLVYCRRGSSVDAAGVYAPGLRRATTGLALVALGATVVVSQPLVLSIPSPSVRFIGWGSAKVAQTYFGQAGLAAIQIGLMRQLGQEIPERYRRPFAAASPLDFWKRWNIYVGSWILLYIFQPLAFLMIRSRASQVLPRIVIRSSVVILCFLFVGGLHDLYPIASSQSWSSTGAMWWFGCVGGVAMGWEALFRQRDGRSRLSRVVATALTMSVVIFFAAVYP